MHDSKTGTVKANKNCRQLLRPSVRGYRNVQIYQVNSNIMCMRMSPKGTVLHDRLFAAGLSNYQTRRFPLRMSKPFWCVVAFDITVSNYQVANRADPDRQHASLIDLIARSFICTTHGHSSTQPIRPGVRKCCRVGIQNPEDRCLCMSTNCSKQNCNIVVTRPGLLSAQPIQPPVTEGSR